MDFRTRQILIKRSKKAVIYLVALFFVLYVLADVSVLQAVHGSEVMGIPPAHHSADMSGNKPGEVSRESDRKDQLSFSKADEHGDANEDCNDDDNCLAGCSHIVVSYFVFASRSTVEIKQNQNILRHENTIPMSEPSDIFHPPKTA